VAGLSGDETMPFTDFNFAFSMFSCWRAALGLALVLALRCRFGLLLDDSMAFGFALRLDALSASSSVSIGPDGGCDVLLCIVVMSMVRLQTAGGIKLDRENRRCRVDKL